MLNVAPQTERNPGHSGAMADASKAADAVDATGSLSVGALAVPDSGRLEACSICEAFSPTVTAAIADHCEDNGASLKQLTVVLDRLVDFALRLSSLSRDKRVEIVEGVVQAATANIRAVYHKMDDMALSGSQFEHQFTAAIQSAWAEVESAIIEATLPANPLPPIPEGKEAMAVANDELTRKVEELEAEKRPTPSSARPSSSSGAWHAT